MKLYEAARQLPLRHISIRVPWHDAGWLGKVCSRPRDNTACLVLPRIRETKRDAVEDDLRERSWDDLTEEQFPACVAERAAFMSPSPFARVLEHPYVGSSKAHEHFKPTRFAHPAYSANCIPFRWMLSDGAAIKAEALELDFRPDLEEKIHEVMGFQTSWVQTRHNQLALLDTFFGAFKPHDSLCFFYAKQTPLTEDSRRVIIGVGRVTHIGDLHEYEYTRKGGHRAVIWDRIVEHSIRPSFKDGFLFPYHNILELAAQDQEIDPKELVAFAPDESWEEFSYASEHVTSDSAVAALIVCVQALEKIRKVVPGNWNDALTWLNGELNRLWKLRGPYPGLGSALTAFGVEHGDLVTYEIAAAQQRSAEGPKQNPWRLVDQAMKDPDRVSPGLGKRLGATIRTTFQKLPAKRRALLELLSRFRITQDQATRFYQPTEREKARIDISDGQLIENPYLLYELDRGQRDQIPVAVIDRGVLPDSAVEQHHPLPAPTRLDGPLDQRRVRALLVNHLERAANEGHTLLPRERAIQAIRDSEVRPKCPVGTDVMAAIEETFEPVVYRVEMTGTGTAYQLNRLVEVGAVIRRTVEKRIAGKRHSGTYNWRALVDAALPPSPKGEDAKLEATARQEKAAALAELFASRVSVLIGPAGTGKTTLLKVLCGLPDVRDRGILLLAPTGKARVRMETQIGIKAAQTVAQFLVPLDRYDTQTGTYRLSGQAKIEPPNTVIIDEASMLTEDQLAAVIDAIKPPQRLVLVGDPSQLPPIGSGRPFVDIVNWLSPKNAETIFPRVAPGYAHLTVRRRQKGHQRDDLLLAEWFSGRSPDAGADEIWDRVRTGLDSPQLKVLSWDDDEQLQDLLLDQIVKELELSGRDDEDKFEESLGGSAFGEAVYFHPAQNDAPGAASKVESWQILSPLRGGLVGVETINRVIQKQFRRRAFQWAVPDKPWWRKTAKPQGRHGILYGDKVINTVNANRDRDVYPKPPGAAYVANGDIGIVVGQYKGIGSKLPKLPWKLEVEFASQPGFKYGYWGRDFGEEGNQALDLAYALTVHKTQGSEFGITFVIIPNPCRLLSPELLYTALTRQRDKVIVLHQGDLAELRRYSNPHYSDIACRMTNLLAEPNLVSVDDRLLEKGLIHRTHRGEAVRSKSEVIVAELLYERKIDYQYEKELVGKDGTRRWPDFTIEDAESGQTIYWEHLGMMHDPSYAERWKRKLAWYRALKILPYEQGGGKGGILVETRDGKQGGIDCEKIASLIDEIFGGGGRRPVTVSDEAAARLALVPDGKLRDAVREALRAGASLPEVGYELADASGRVQVEAELAWPALKIAIVRLDQRSGSAEFVRRGWRVIHAGDFLKNPRATLQ